MNPHTYQLFTTDAMLAGIKYACERAAVSGVDTPQVNQWRAAMARETVPKARKQEGSKTV